MSLQKQLQAHLNNLCPGLILDRWQADDAELANRVAQFIQQPDQSSPTIPDAADHSRQALYLAEEICLDSFYQGNLAEGLGRYLKRYIAMHFPNDQVRAGLINRICQEATTNTQLPQSDQLRSLLTNPPSTIPHHVASESCTLETMKGVTTANRFGDIVFLPTDAEVIIIGDTHGDLAATQWIIQRIKKERLIEQGAFVVFLGDYVHNGTQSWRNLLEILSFQQANPNSVILLNGNHEFRESYLTALNEYFRVHWERAEAEEVRVSLPLRRPQNDNHYGHLRLDLIRSFGFAKGEKIYAAFVEWGIQLPIACIAGDRMFSHSVGKLPKVDLTMVDLLHAKQQDAPVMRRLGYETWNVSRLTLHSALVNNRHITVDLLNTFGYLLDVDHFVVGHCHYRSGDTVQMGDKRITTVVSSEPYSPDSGTYMFQQMVVARGKMQKEEKLSEGDAVACYLKSTALRHEIETKKVTTQAKLQVGPR